MADAIETGSNTPAAPKKNLPPMKTVFVITGGEGEKKVWTKVGVAFLNKDGSLNVILNVAMPQGQKLHIREENRRAQTA